mmetsp:Transcript_8240/g.13804  ORF Transcript_8240/g.13804 Transcript_8240/m.13804 type:complete len:82 (+) Transcript_8240:567-812(+)
MEEDPDFACLSEKFFSVFSVFSQEPLEPYDFSVEQSTDLGKYWEKICGAQRQPRSAYDEKRSAQFAQKAKGTTDWTKGAKL